MKERRRRIAKLDKRIKARKREQEQEDANKEEGAKRRKLVHKRVGEKWGEMSQPSDQADSVSEIILVRAPPGREISNSMPLRQ